MFGAEEIVEYLCIRKTIKDNESRKRQLADKGMVASEKMREMLCQAGSRKTEWGCWGICKSCPGVEGTCKREGLWGDHVPIE